MSLLIYLKPMAGYLKNGWIFTVTITAYISLGSCSLMYVANGTYLETHGQYEKAIEAWDHAIAANPKSSISYYHRAYDYSKLGRYQNTVDDAAKAIQLLDKQSIKARAYIKEQAYITQANAHMHLNQYKNAIDDASQALQLNPKSGTAYFYRSQSYQKLDKADLAKSDMAKANELGYTSEPSKPVS